MGIKTAKRFPKGMLVYVESSVSAEEILDRFLEQNAVSAERQHCLEILEGYLKELQTFKIGNVLSIRYSTAGEFSLYKILDAPPTQGAVKLPG